MSLTNRETWTLIHGMLLGALFLLSFAGGLAGLYSMRAGWLTSTGLRERIARLNLGTSVMAVVAWLTVVSGTWIVYPWYRVPLPPGQSAAALGADLVNYPKQLLVSNPALAEWHTFAMEWKEHVAWFAPILATAVAFVVVRYGLKIANQDQIRRALLTLFVFAFCAAGIAGLFGALITKAAPVH